MFAQLTLLGACLTLAAHSNASAASRCGNYRVPAGELYQDVVAKRTSCKVARAVVRGWARTDPSDDGWRTLDAPGGWRCRYLIRPVRFQCVRGRRSVRFLPGPGF